MFSYEYIMYFFTAIAGTAFISKANGGAFFKNPFSYITVILCVAAYVVSDLLEASVIIAALISGMLMVLYSLTLKGKILKRVLTALTPTVMNLILGVLFLWIWRTFRE